MKNNVDWDHLRIFLAAERGGSFRKAAEKLGVNHGTVHRAIKSLETTLGARVFDRTASGLKLTQSGETLLPPAEEMELQVDAAARKLTGLDLTPSGNIRFSLPPAFSHGLLTDILAGFQEGYPDIKVEVISTNRVTDLKRFEADVSMRVSPAVDEDLFGRKLIKFVQAAFASPSYLKSHPDLLETQGADAHWIAWSNKTDWIASSPLPRAAVRHIMPEVSMQLEAAAGGLGIAKVPAFIGDVDPRLVRVPGIPLMSGHQIWLLYHGDLRRVARVRAFVDYIVAYFAKNKNKFIT
ncbi:MAG: LysR family transcriptional regulator [Roseibium sp.]